LAGKPAEEQTKEPVARGGEKQDEEAG
jgi:hypothetical protein